MKTFNKIWTVFMLLGSVALIVSNIIDKDNSEAIAWSIISLANLSAVLDAFGLKGSASVEVEKKEVE